MSEPTTQILEILLVEDNPADAVLLKSTLAETSFGPFHVTQVKRLADAVARLRDEKFDVVLLDLGLPDSQGLETLKLMRRQARDLPIVILTGLADERLGVAALNLGAQDYLVKGDDSAGTTMARSIRYAIERRAAQIAAHQREAEMAHMARVNTMGHMASGLAHELNQPLGAILNYAGAALEMGESRHDLPAATITSLREIMDEARRAGAIISRLRSFVGKHQPSAVPLDANVLIEESVHLLGFELLHQGVRPRLLLADGLPKVLADPVHIEQVLVNLMYNALEAMEDVARAAKNLAVQTALSAGGDSVEVAVIDSGAGVPPGQMRRLFEAFYTTKAKGLGMGLNISRTIVESHGGRLDAAPNPGGGMKFSFTLPSAQGAST
jgi:C4-dicarboxylate-specific signal transduction histidine kinase